MADIQQTLDERGDRYGDWKNHAQISQDIQNAIVKGWFQRGDGQDLNEVPAYMLESLVMIANKIGRIINGDPYYDDSWRDIAGYATLVVEELNKKDVREAESDGYSQKEQNNATQELQENREQTSV